MIVLGLTGSIGMGKTTAAGLLRRLGVPVHDADAAVHRLTARHGAALPAIALAFPGVVADGRLDRRALGARVFGDPAELARLEAILHPLVQTSSRAFLKRCAFAGRRVAALDIPLLFETGAEARCDLVVVVSAPALIQRQRVLSRPGMTPEAFAAVLARQMPDREKRRRADRVVPTGLGLRPTLQGLDAAVRLAESMTPTAWPPDSWRERMARERALRRRREGRVAVAGPSRAGP
ncbi:MAG: dephospho-CoA kinase [Azospirillaceae bacterium]